MLFVLQVGYLCGGVKMLRSQRTKPDQIVYQSLAYLAKIKKSLFYNEYIINALCSLLKKDTGPSAFKSLNAKITPSVYYLVINLFITAFQDIKRWPETFIKV